MQVGWALHPSLDEWGDSTLNYHARHMYHWDFWMIEREGQVHSFYLFRLRPEALANEVSDPHGLDWLGHAVSDDLITWHEESNVIPLGPAGSLDDMKHFTGHIIEKDGLYYLFYTGRSSREAARVQRTMLATSENLYDWTKHAGNPVMVGYAELLADADDEPRQITLPARSSSISTTR